MRKPHKHTIKGKPSTKKAMMAALKDMSECGISRKWFNDEYKILAICQYDNIIYYDFKDSCIR